MRTGAVTYIVVAGPAFVINWLLKSPHMGLLAGLTTLDEQIDPQLPQKSKLPDFV